MIDAGQEAKTEILVEIKSVRGCAEMPDGEGSTTFLVLLADVTAAAVVAGAAMEGEGGMSGATGFSGLGSTPVSSSYDSPAALAAAFSAASTSENDIIQPDPVGESLPGVGIGALPWRSGNLYSRNRRRR